MRVPVQNSPPNDQSAAVGPANAEHSVTDVSVGIRIRHVRSARGLSLQQVADKAGLSVGHLSQIERGGSSASVRVLSLAADALAVGVADFFPARNQEQTSLVTRIFEREVVQFGTSGVSKELLTVNGERSGLDLFIIRISGSEDGRGQAYSHSGIEAGFVLSGGFELEVDQRTYLLGEGDACCFASTRPHKFQNAGQSEAVVLWVNYQQAETLIQQKTNSDELEIVNSVRKEDLP